VSAGDYSVSLDLATSLGMLPAQRPLGESDLRRSCRPLSAHAPQRRNAH